MQYVSEMLTPTRVGVHHSVHTQASPLVSFCTNLGAKGLVFGATLDDSSVRCASGFARTVVAIPRSAVATERRAVELPCARTPRSDRS